MGNHTLKTTLGCLLAAVLLAGCEKNEAPQATGATGQASLAPQGTGASSTAAQVPPAGGQASLAAPSGYSAAQRAAWDDACAAAIEDAGIRGASNAEFDKIARSKMCNY